MIAFTQTVYSAILLAAGLITVSATSTATAITGPPYHFGNTTQLSTHITRTSIDTTFLTSVTAAPTVAELASVVRDGPANAGDRPNQWQTSLGGPDCMHGILDHDPECYCCKWRHPARPAACGKMKCCPCIKQTCDPKDLNCRM